MSWFLNAIPSLVINLTLHEYTSITLIFTLFINCTHHAGELHLATPGPPQHLMQSIAVALDMLDRPIQAKTVTTNTNVYPPLHLCPTDRDFGVPWHLRGCSIDHWWAIIFIFLFILFFNLLSIFFNLIYHISRRMFCFYMIYGPLSLSLSLCNFNWVIIFFLKNLNHILPLLMDRKTHAK